MLSEERLQQLVKCVYDQPQLRGCIVAYCGEGQCREVASPFCFSATSENVAVVLEEIAVTDGGITAELRRLARAGQGVPRGAPGASVVTNRSRIGPELIGAGIACGLTFVSALGVMGGVAGEVCRPVEPRRSLSLHPGRGSPREEFNVPTASFVLAPSSTTLATTCSLAGTTTRSTSTASYWWMLSASRLAWHHSRSLFAISGQ